VRFSYREKLSDPAQPENVRIDEGSWDLIGALEPDSIQFVCRAPFNPGGARKPRAVFELASQPYDLGITDSIVAPKLRGSMYGSYSAADLAFRIPPTSC
jgi:hypothetical protein